MNLGYFETLINGHIRTLDDGAKIFYAQGICGRRGYLIPSTEIEKTLRKAIKRFYWCFFIILFIFFVLMGPSISKFGFTSFFIFMAVSIIIVMLITRLYYFAYTKNMEPVKTPYPWISYWSKMGETLHPAALGGLGLTCLFFFISGALLYKSTNEPMMLFCSAFFALMLIPYSIAIWHKLKK